jgi:hypothetical protein
MEISTDLARETRVSVNTSLVMLLNELAYKGPSDGGRSLYGTYREYKHAGRS